MNDVFEMTTGQAHDFALACRRNGLTKEDVKKMSQGNFLATILTLLNGTGVVQIVKHVLNMALDAMPKVWKDQGGWNIPAEDQIATAINGGVHDVAEIVKQVVFHLSPSQKDGKVAKGHNLHTEFKTSGLAFLNGVLLDYLIEHPELIPESWKFDENGKTRYIFFWGSIYRGSDGRLYVRYLCWSGGEWDWGYGWLGDDWRGLSPAAVLASVPQP